MKRPYTICYMMTSVDARIDCAMTTQLPGEEYYPILDELNFDAVVSGKTTAELEIAEKGKFVSATHTPVNREVVSNKSDGTRQFEVVVDTKGTLLWRDNEQYDEHVLIVASEQATEEYLDYLDGKHISYIVTGKDKIDLMRAVEILGETFEVKRLGVVGGAKINTSFLDADLLDEISLLIGAGIDGRESYPTVFCRKDESLPVKQLKLLGVKTYPQSGAVLVRYATK